MELPGLQPALDARALTAPTGNHALLNLVYVNVI